MARVRGSSVLLYLVDQSLQFTNTGLAADAGVIQVNGTDITISDMAVAATIQNEMNTSFSDELLPTWDFEDWTASNATVGDADTFTTTAITGYITHNFHLLVGGIYRMNIAGTAAGTTGLAVTSLAGTEYKSVMTGTFDETFTFTCADDGSLLLQGSVATGQVDITSITLTRYDVVTVALVSETFTITFNDGTFNTMKVWINTVSTVVTDSTTPTADNLIAEQTNIDLAWDLVVDDVTNKDSGGFHTEEPIERVLNVTNENIYSDSDANYQLLRDAWKNEKLIYAYITKASGTNIYCPAVIESLSEPAPVKSVVRATVTWHSSGTVTRV